MFFKHNKDQENDCDVYQEKHEVTTKYFVKLDDGQFVAKNWYDNAVSQGTGEYWKYTMNELKDAKRMQREYGGTIYEEVEDKYVRPYQQTQIDSSDAIKELKNDAAPKSRINAEMAVNVKLDTAELTKSINELKEALCSTTAIASPIDQSKIHELSKYEQAYGVCSNNHVSSYYVNISNPETIALLSKPNTRLAIIEDDVNA